MKKTKEMEDIFWRANNNFLKKNSMLFETKVAERTLCGALMLELHDVLKNTEYSNYFVDVEYNRNSGGKLKTYRKTIKGSSEEVVTINCDLIVHSRGTNCNQDNLIAIEMKKSTARARNKLKDRERLECLTKKPEDEVWSYGGEVFPEHVCGYLLGVYYEVNFRQEAILIEFYRRGNMYKSFLVDLKANLVQAKAYLEGN